MIRVSTGKTENRPFDFAEYLSDPDGWQLNEVEARQFRAARVMAAAGDSLTIIKSIGNLAQILAGAVLEIANHTGATGPNIDSLRQLDGVAPTFTAEDKTSEQAVNDAASILAVVRANLGG